jgi:uncharacterized damage-inducible protein DinB
VRAAAPVSQTHHRGEVSALLSQCGVDMGATDLLALIPEVKPARQG